MFSIVVYTTVVDGSMFGIVVFTTVVVGSMYGIVVLRHSCMVICLALLLYDSRGWLYVWCSCLTTVVVGTMYGIVGFTTVVDGSMFGIVALRQSWMVLCLA